MANPTRRTPGLRSQSPTGRFASSTSAFSGTTSFFQNHRSASPTRVNLYGSSASPSTYSLSFDNRQMPRGGNQTAVKKQQLQAPKRMCMCSPTSHPGSFRCSLHKSIINNNNNHSAAANTASYPSSRLNARRSAMTNSLVRIGTVEGGDLVKRALAALIRPSSHQQRRRTSFQPTRSRLSVMTF